METKESVLTPKVQPVVPIPPAQKKPLVKPLISKRSKKATFFMILSSFLVVVLGVVTGWFLAGKGKTVANESNNSSQTSSNKEIEEAGLGDEKSYASTTEGVLKKGGIKGEGTHYIDRGLGENKYVYLTSSVVDLDSFVDKKVTVWGETISAKYASWMIDVGKIKVVK
jgi:hypothetical protein